MGYKGQGGISLHEQGIVEPVQATRNPYTQGLGYGQRQRILTTGECILAEVATVSPNIDNVNEMDHQDSFSDFVNFFDSSICTIHTVTTLASSSNDLPLVYPELIDWDQWGPPIFDIATNDEAITEMMGFRDHFLLGDHRVGYIMELDMHAYFGETTPTSSHKNIKIKNGSDGENCSVAVSDPKKEKTKDVSPSENLHEALGDGSMGLPEIDKVYLDISPVLVEPAQEMNLRTEEEPKITYRPESLSTQEQENFLAFFT